MSSPKHSNRLVHETSPYLLQHAHNPVDWYPWGEEALSRAREKNKLILLSIGYSACHWCHVMEHESFENEAIAELMNHDFVNIKVDREERPDLDDIYMAATVAMNQGQGGWPMTVFLTPDLQPIFAGTYFPPDDRAGRPGFASLLQRITQAWAGDREELVKSASLLTARLRQEKEGAAPPMAVGEEELRAALVQYTRDFDAEHGGFGSAPKFPPAAALQLLLRLHRRFDDEQALEMVRKTLDGMARGGLYDQVGGGFARYSTDGRWLVPHFEKMLYDNALLVSAYLDGYQVTGSDLYRRIVTETLDYIRREMTSEDGGIYSATDADSEGVEGKFFVWTPEQIAEILDEDEARCFNAFYDIRPGGNWEGSSIPNTPRSLEEVAAELSKTPEELRGILDTAREKVYQGRLLRVAPGLDDKILTAWNGMMIAALAQAYDVLGERDYLEAAERAADFVLGTLRRDDGGLFRTCRAGKAHLDAYLEDYAWMTEALLTLHEVSGDIERLDQATQLAERLLSDFLDGENGGFFNTAHGHEKLILRYRDGTDGATPSGNAVAASALARLSFHSGRDDVRASQFRQAAMGALKAHGRLMTRFPRAFAKSLSVVDFLLEGPVELALVGEAEGDDLEVLRREVARHYVPNRIQAISSGAADDDSLPPLLRGKLPVDGKAALYICRDFTCRAPVTEVSAVAEALGAARAEVTATSLATRLPGRATAEGTRRYASRQDATRGDHGFVSLGTTDLQVSRLGFGSYRVGDTDDGHRDALHHALASGINLVDTSTNYIDGSSERLIGSVLRQRVDAGQLQRDEVVVVSKIGYVQGKNFELARQREAEGRGFPEMVKIDNGPPEGRYGLWHCLHPEYLEDQLGRSLDRLELETLDVCLLHNPEYFLAHEVRRGESLDSAREEFYRRLKQAFRYFEGEVRAGRLGVYGVSSNTVGAPVVAGDATSLSRMLDAARAAGGDGHHFRVLQLPLNLFEAGPLLEFNTGDPAVTALGLAREQNLAVLVNRPLNAFTEEGLLRLSEVDSGGDPVDFEAQVRRLADLEEKFRQNIASRLRPSGAGVSAEDGVSAKDGVSAENDPDNTFRWADELPALQARLRGLDQWSQVATQIAYMVNRTAAMFDQNLSGELEQHWDAFKGQYFPVLNGLLGEMRRQLAIQAEARSAAIAGAIDPLLPADRRDASLSQKALWTVASTPGVTVVLSGMRRVEYVDDAVAVLGWSSLSSVDGIYQAAGGIELPE